MVTVPEAENLLKAQHLPGKECGSISGVLSDERSDWMLNLVVFNQLRDCQGMEACVTLDKPATTLLQLETGCISHSDECLYTGLVEYQSICKPTMEFDWKSPGQITGGQEHSVGSNNSTLTIPIMVSSGDGPVDRHAMTPSSSTRPDDVSGGGNVIRGNLRLVAWPISNNHIQHRVFLPL